MPEHHQSRGRRPARRFLALSSDALYTSEPPRRLEATGLHVDPPNVIELIASATSLRDEPEAIGGAILDAFGVDAVFFQSARHAATVSSQRGLRRAMHVEDRVADVKARARSQHRQDLRGDVRSLEDAVVRARRAQPARLELVQAGGGSFTAAVVERPWLVVSDAQLERLERVEAALDRAPEVPAA